MKSRHLFLHLVAAWLVFPFGQAFAATSVTFDVLATFDYPGATSTYALKPNDNGDVGGWLAQGPLVRHGFVRFRDGHLSRPIVVPNSFSDVTTVTGISNSGTVFGYYLQSGVFYQGFFLSGSTFTLFDVSGTMNTEIWGVNDAGDFCGNDQIDSGHPFQAFVSIGGTVTSFTIAGSTFTFAYGINNLGQSVGEFDLAAAHGFFRDTDGTLTWPIDTAGSLGTYLYGINDRSWMVGVAYDRSGGHGVLFQSPSKATEFDYPGANTTVFSGINNRGLICGWYEDPSQVSHGLLVRVKPIVGD